MNARKSAVKWAGAGALSVLLATTSAFAAPRHNRDQNGTDDQAQTQAQVQSNQRGSNGNRGNAQRTYGQQQAPAPVVTQPVAESRVNANQRQQYGSRTNDQSWGNASQSRGRADQSNGYQQNDNRSNSYRENQRVNVTGRIQSFNRERNGYRVRIDNGSYWIPEARFGNRARDLRVGLAITLGGIFRGGAIGIDAVSWPVNGGYGYDQSYVRGVIQQVDYRSGTMALREQTTGRLFEVDMRDAGFGSRLHRGDFVTLSGQWLRGGVFAAYRVDSVH
ncbi:MAG: hypothetical protein QOK37_1470 [Thermoanaerobaculia bacterium]|jgi:hypothetical protein|nr:hypothetical protein [Thermoanaerobaculia bacterium]